jgi:GH43 family beta-xylosidase
MPKASEGKPETFCNPVYPHSFPDPFVLKFRGEYFGYCTGDAADNNVFGILRSADLVHWEYVGSAMEPLASRPPFYWAPEVVYDNGKFYCYYSAGNEILMEIRVAVSDRPDGGFVDAGVRLTTEEFAIDAHVFVDDDGTRWMFYATDFLEHSHIGTGTVVDRMIDWNRLEGKPRPVTRAKYDWQVYDPARKEKGGVRWHTVEGPAVLKRKGKYFEMFSGGNWQNKSYGVSFAIADTMKFKEEWEQFSDGEKILPILRTIPDKVIGPGHNSVVRGPNNRELYCVYHRWTEAGRVLAIDRMDFAGDRLFVAGPTTTPQPLPLEGRRNVISDLTGWMENNAEFTSAPGESNSMSLSTRSRGFLLEFWIKFEDAVGRAGLRARNSLFELDAAKGRAIIQIGKLKKSIKLGRNFDPSAWHLVRVESGLTSARVTINDARYSTKIKGQFGDDAVVLFSENTVATIAAIEMTHGFEELFEEPDVILESFVITGDAAITDRQLSIASTQGNKAGIAFEIPFENFELAANLATDPAASGSYGIVFRTGHREIVRLIVSASSDTVTFAAGSRNTEIKLPESFSGNELRQFRIVKSSSDTTAYLDGIHLATLKSDEDITLAAIFGHQQINVEMLRLTSLDRSFVG